MNTEPAENDDISLAHSCGFNAGVAFTEARQRAETNRLLPHACPQCGHALHEVPRHSTWMNDDQYNAVKAGDWYCGTCPPIEGRESASGLRYWFDSEVESAERSACESITRC